MEDLTRAGYGLHPARVLTWRRFWYAWVHQFLERTREKRESQIYPIYIASLQTAPKKASNILASLQAENAKADRNTLKALNASLPPSIRELLDLGSMAANVNKARSILDWWDQKLAEVEPGTKAYRFLEAGKKAAIDRTRRLN